MLKKIKSIGISNVARIVFLFIVAFRMCCHLFYTTEMEFQTFRDLEMYKAMILLCILCIVYRKIKINDYVSWIYALVGFGAQFMFFRAKVITPETYGPDYYQVLVCKGILYVFFVGLLLDLFRHKPYSIKNYIKTPAVICYILFMIVFCVIDKESFIPFFCPVLAVLFTRFSDENCKELSYILSVSAYLAFCYIFTRSLLFDYNRYLEGRYYGSFLQVGSASSSCAIAFCGCIYFFFVCKNKKIYGGMIFSLLLAIYPIIAIVMMGSRSAELGVLLVIIGIWCFLHGKGTKVTLVRTGIMFLLIVSAPFILLGLSQILYMMVNSGTIIPERLNYFWSHIYNMTAVKENKESIFQPGSIWFSFDVFSSIRLTVYLEKVKMIKFMGARDVSGVDAHNIFLAYLIKYGLIGGIPFFGWFVSCIIMCVKFIERKIYLIYPLFLFLLMLGCYSTLPLYITCFGGCMMLITQVFCVNIIREDNL